LIETVEPRKVLKEADVDDTEPVVPVRPYVIPETVELDSLIDAEEITNVEQCIEAVKSVASAHCKVLNKVNENMACLENEISQLWEKLEDSRALDKAYGCNIKKLHIKTQQIQQEIQKFEEITDKLLDDKEKRDTHVNVLSFNTKKCLNDISLNFCIKRRLIKYPYP